MLQTIIDFCQNIVDAIHTIIDVIISFFTDLVDVVQSIIRSYAYVPELLRFLPPIILATVLSAFTIIIVLRVVGRD